MMYQVEVPPGYGPRQQFQVMIGDQLMAVTVPDGVGPGSIIQVAGPQSAPIITTGVPVMPSGPEGQGVPVTVGMVEPVVGMVEPGVEVHAQQQIQFVETDEISPAGW